MTVHAERGSARGLRRTYSVVLTPALVESADLLVESGMFRSRSHLVEEAIRMLLAYHGDRVSTLRPSGDRDVA